MQEPLPEGAAVFDSFDVLSGPFKGRVPAGASSGGWQAEAGEWVVEDGAAVEKSGFPGDARVLVDAGPGPVEVKADLRWSEGYAGVVFRYRDPANWMMAWYADTEDLVIASLVDGMFAEAGRFPMHWGAPGEKHSLTVKVRPQTLTVLVDGHVLGELTNETLADATGVGLFTRWGAANRFESFEVRRIPLTDVQVSIPPDPASVPRFIEEWRALRVEPEVGGSFLDAGYIAETLVSEGIAHPVSLTFGGDVLYVAATELLEQKKGAVYALRLGPDGSLSAPVLYAAGFHRPTGILALDGRVFVSSRGQITALRDTDGDLVADEAKVVLDGLPFGRPDVLIERVDHQTNGMMLGPDGMIYVAQGSRTDRGPVTAPLEGTVFRMAQDGSKVEVFAKGFRNPFDLAFDKDGRLFSTDNSADPLGDEVPPDELNYVRQGGDYGFPAVLGEPPAGSATVAPFATWVPSFAPAGMTFSTGAALGALAANDLLIVKWNFQVVMRVRVEGGPEGFRVVEAEDVVGRFGTPPTDVTIGPDGWIYVADWGGGRIVRVRAGG